jgi:hypothetical protein
MSAQTTTASAQKTEKASSQTVAPTQKATGTGTEETITSPSTTESAAKVLPPSSAGPEATQNSENKAVPPGVGTPALPSGDSVVPVEAVKTAGKESAQEETTKAAAGSAQPTPSQPASVVEPSQTRPSYEVGIK